MPKPTYDVDYFIKKFEAIPDNKWHIGKFYGPDGRCCAIGHCALKDKKGRKQFDPSIMSPEAISLSSLFKTYDMSVYSINDGIGEIHKYECFQHIPFTPKERILRALKWIKERIEEEPV